VDAQQLEKLRIRSEDKRRRRGGIQLIFAAVALATVVAIYLAWPKGEERRLAGVGPGTNRLTTSSAASTNSSNFGSSTDALLTVTGYIVNRERIEISPRFLGVVKWIGVKKGDTVTNGQVVVLLDDSEQRRGLRKPRRSSLMHGSRSKRRRLITPALSS
jgi:multidrug efflux pump subunit AcrA (membrane-fusion protein)